MSNLKQLIGEQKAELIGDYLPEIESTQTPVEKEFTLRNRSAVLSCFLTGVCLFTMPGEVADLSKYIIADKPIEAHTEYFERYESNIGYALNKYFEEISSITSKQNFSKHELITEILSFKTLNNNWDGYGAIPLEVRSAANILTLMDLIDENVFCTVDDIYPNPNGTISLSWNNHSGETVSLEVGNETLSYYVALSSQETLFFNEIKINGKEAEKISKQIERL